MRRICDPQSPGLLPLLVVLLAATAISVAWLTGSRADTALSGGTAGQSSRVWIETQGAWLPTTTNEWLERLNGPSTSQLKRGNASLDSKHSPRKYAPLSGVTRIPAVGGSVAAPPPGRSETGKNTRSSSGGSKKIAASKSNDDGEDDESPWTMEESRGTYRTLCVRMCDGYYFPISFATTKDNFARDAKVCERSCKSPARLFFHENPGQAPEDMEDARGKRYKDLKVAFAHQKQYDEACTCKAQPWDEAALARHRQFAEAAERKKGRKKDDNRHDTLEQVSGFRERTAHSANHDSFELDQALLPPALTAVSVKRRQSLAPAHLLRGLRLSPLRGIPLYQTPASVARQPQQSRPGVALGIAASRFVEFVGVDRPNRAVTVGIAQPSRSSQPLAKASGQNASAAGLPLGAAAASPATRANGKKLADGAETQVR